MADDSVITTSRWTGIGFILDGEDFQPGDVGILLSGPVGYGYSIADLHKFAAAADLYDSVRELLTAFGSGFVPRGAYERAQAALERAEPGLVHISEPIGRVMASLTPRN